MPLRQKLKRIFSRPSPSPSKPTSPAKPTTILLAGIKPIKIKPRPTTTDPHGNPLIELYQPHEVLPRSKYRGPFDAQHLRALAEYSIPAATVERPRSVVSESEAEFSPRGTGAPPTRRGSVVAATIGGEGVGGEGCNSTVAAGAAGWTIFNDDGGGEKNGESGDDDGDTTSGDMSGSDLVDRTNGVNTSSSSTLLTLRTVCCTEETKQTGSNAVER
ncbi:hypothetical protein PRK78_006669 [Emydomyces testavorans]|uniref:Uncharacterized protein n=1 Tax=Emydomyces testavorans TaxID=2070801 RepID=A0AAF0DLU5_9EURO|nr:hypothetical protein PRK78_006669 [Emydomyces testavorans]